MGSTLVLSKLGSRNRSENLEPQVQMIRLLAMLCTQSFPPIKYAWDYRSWLSNSIG